MRRCGVAVVALGRRRAVGRVRRVLMVRRMVRVRRRGRVLIVTVGVVALLRRRVRRGETSTGRRRRVASLRSASLVALIVIR